MPTSAEIVEFQLDSHDCYNCGIEYCDCGGTELTCEMCEECQFQLDDSVDLLEDEEFEEGDDSYGRVA